MCSQTFPRRKLHRYFHLHPTTRNFLHIQSIKINSNVIRTVSSKSLTAGKFHILPFSSSFYFTLSHNFFRFFSIRTVINLRPTLVLFLRVSIIIYDATENLRRSRKKFLSTKFTIYGFYELLSIDFFNG